jgi:hypothetical protein
MLCLQPHPLRVGDLLRARRPALLGRWMKKPGKAALVSVLKAPVGGERK